ncbi:peptide/nickel transport system substrate-binding protein [Caldanaerobius fijiensis DSM 17918]|uniref:Peptide/nickel transport system substrate-binding protein n=1 Tax=Caldanaerobius fijiensis DSM 17918 TaxID=1121256 RepID=A0A1M5FB28_9THEO|nr:ABC transporter substrate-binding protein [Caldanaerobius fijiensis]SHF88727.1 peptide/nickel transport system substrate-binding protein [Caldanaerobius fijiensis DSM 17918]
MPFKNLSRGISVFMLIVMLFSIILTGCGNKTLKTSNNVSSKKTNSASSSEGPKYNKQKVFRLGVWGGWPKPPLYQGNPFGSGGIGPGWTYGMEGLYQFVRSTDKIYPRLAESMPENQGNKSIVHLRKDVKWNDGKPFTSKDIWAYYTLNNGAFITKFLKSVDTPDDYTVVFVWNDPQPNEKVKNLLIAQDYQATIPYHIYGKYVDRAAEILKQAKPADTLDKRGAFGLNIIEDKKVNTALNKNWQEFIKFGPKLPVGTGPYMVKTVTASDLIMVKNPYYYNKDKVHFDTLTFKQVGDAAASIAMLRAGQVDSYPGTLPKDMVDSILAANKDLVLFKMFDPADIGMVFNIQKPPFDDVKFRRAIIYAFDKDKIRQVGNYYSETHPYSVTGMPVSFIKDWVPQDIQDKMTRYSYDPQKAEQLLKEIGWSKGSDGIWRDKNGKMYNFVIGSNAGWVQCTQPSEIVAEQLTKFGLPTKLMAKDGSIYYREAQIPYNKFDMSAEWIDVTWGFLIPWWPLSNFYWGFPSNAGNFPRVKEGPRKGQLNMVLPGPDGKMVDINKVLNEMLYMSDEDMKKAAGDLVWIANENAFGLDYFQNVTGVWGNIKTIRGWPYNEQLYQKYNRNMPVPTDPEDIERVAETNLGFAGAQMLVDGTYFPN